MQRKHIYIKLIYIGIIIGGIIFFTYVNPAHCTWAPKCMFKLATGWQCPGCGFSRAAHALLHGHMTEALAYNYFFVISLPYAAAVIIANSIPADTTGRLHKFRHIATHRYLAWFYISAFCIWWVIRNILGI